MKIKRALAVSAVIACMLSTTVFAADVSNQNTSTNDQKSSVQMNSGDFGGSRGMHGDEFGGPGNFGEEKGSPLASLVTAGTITQAQLDAIETTLKDGRDAKKTMKETLDALVTAGTITQAQEDAIVKNLPTRDGKGGLDGKHENPLTSLVTAGTITQAQLDAIETAMKDGRDAKKTPKDTLDTLVTAGTITQAQEDAIVKSIPTREGKGGFDGKHENPLTSLVTAGTITQAQLDAIETALKDGRDSKKTMKETLDTLVTAGTITSEQEITILKSLPSGEPPRQEQNRNR